MVGGEVWVEYEVEVEDFGLETAQPTNSDVQQDQSHLSSKEISDNTQNPFQ